MKLLAVLLVSSMLFLSCQKEELDCLQEKEKINEMYMGILENDDLTARQRQSIQNQWKIELDQACN